MEQTSKKWILIRGLIRSQFHWLDFPKKLQLSIPQSVVLTPELKGNGLNSNQIFYKNIEDCISDLEHQCELSGHYKVNLIGISLGGMIAASWAQNKPKHIQNLVLINSSLSDSPFYQRLRIENYPKIFQFLVNKDPLLIEKFIIEKTMNSSDKLKYLDSFVDFQKKHPVTLINFYRQLQFARTVDIYKRPIENTLVLSSQQDHLVSSKCSHKIAHLWNCPHEIHPWAGHDLPADDSQWIINRIQKHFS